MELRKAKPSVLHQLISVPFEALGSKRPSPVLDVLLSAPLALWALMSLMVLLKSWVQHWVWLLLLLLLLAELVLEGFPVEISVVLRYLMNKVE